MRLRALLSGVLGAALLTGCGASSTTVTVRVPATPQTVTRTVTTSASASSANARRGTGTSGLASGSCVASDLALSFLGGQAATGHGRFAFALRNTSDGTCRTGGYPGVLFLDGAGHALPTTPDHTTDDFFGHTALREFTVAPGATVSFRLGVSLAGSDGSDAGCVTARGLQVIAPNDTATLRVDLAGLSECGGRVTVSPLQPGRAAAAP